MPAATLAFTLPIGGRGRTEFFFRELTILVRVERRQSPRGIGNLGDIDDLVMIRIQGLDHRGGTLRTTAGMSTRTSLGSGGIGWRTLDI